MRTTEIRCVVLSLIGLGGMMTQGGCTILGDPKSKDVFRIMDLITKQSASDGSNKITLYHGLQLVRGISHTVHEGL